MLVLSRHREESVHLSDSIVVQVLAIKGDRVRLGFTAPQDVQIVRSELLRKSPGHITSEAASIDDAGRKRPNVSEESVPGPR
jgi:carbon storage regulator